MVPIVNEMQNVNASTQTVAHRQDLNVNKLKMTVIIANLLV